MEFSRQEYWSGLPFPTPGDLPDLGIEPRSPTMQADTLPSELPGKPILIKVTYNHPVHWTISLQKQLKLALPAVEFWLLSSREDTSTAAQASSVSYANKLCFQAAVAEFLHFSSWSKRQQRSATLPSGETETGLPRGFLHAKRMTSLLLAVSPMFFLPSLPLHISIALKVTYMLVVQSFLTLCDPMDCSPPGSSVHGILQARILQRVAILFERISPTQESNSGLLHCTQILYHLEPQGKPPLKVMGRIYHTEYS